MNRKLINGLLLMATATAGVGMFSSCKDTNEDVIRGMDVQNKDLAAKIAALEADVTTLKDWRPVIEKAINDLQVQLNAKIADLDAAIKANASNIDALRADVTALITAQARLQGDLDALNTKISNIEAAINQRLDVQDTKIADLEKLIDSLTTQLSAQVAQLISDVNQINQTIGGLQADITNLTTRLTAVENDLNSMRTDLGSVRQTADQALAIAQTNAAAIAALEARMDIVEGRVGDLENNVRELQQGLVEAIERINTLEAEVAANTLDIEALWETVDRHSEQIEELQTKTSLIFSALSDLLKKLVTGVIVQGATNPVFGYLNTPFDVRSNMLMAWFGEANFSVNFPVVDSSIAEYNNKNWISGEDIAVLFGNTNADGNEGLQREVRINAGDVLIQNGAHNNNLGSLYVTVNPSNVDFSNMEVSLVTSAGNAAPVEPIRLVKSDEELTFGYTRGENYGFYRADVQLPATKDAAYASAIQIDDRLAAAFKDALKGSGKNDIVKLAQILYDQFNGMCKAYGVRVNWQAKDPEGNTIDYNVLSEYNVAAATARALSYKFLYNESLRELPTFSPISSVLDDIFQELHFNLGLTGMDKVVVDWGEYEIKDASIWINLTGTAVRDEDGNIVGYLGADGQKVIFELKYTQNGVILDDDYLVNVNDNSLNELVSQINTMMGGVVTNLKDVVTSLNTQIDKINEQLLGLEGKINGQLDQALQDIKDRLGNKLDKVDEFISKYNNLAEKINKVLRNPNDYLQVMMAYKGADNNLHHMSTVKDAPTVFTKGTGNSITLYATSHTADLIVPSYMKVVGIVAAYDADGNRDRNMNPLLQEVNYASQINRILPGRQQKIALATDKLKAGYTYEVLYTSMDYSGVTSTNKYYFTVK